MIWLCKVTFCLISKLAFIILVIWLLALAEIYAICLIGENEKAKENYEEVANTSQKVF